MEKKKVKKLELVVVVMANEAVEKDGVMVVAVV